MDLTEAKAAARRAAYERRRIAHEAGGAAAAEAACARLVAALDAATAGGGLRGRTVSGYMPIRSEIDPRPALAALAALGARLCLPVIAGRGLPLGFRAWRPGEPLIDGPFGARVPASGAETEPDTLIVPLLAFDGARFRLGYGGGFYDRTLARLRARGPVTAIGLAFAAQAVPAVPRDAFDQPLDRIATETALV
jgi:5-formyltetrahydrofolate cyclo-ligase